MKDPMGLPQTEQEVKERLQDMFTGRPMTKQLEKEMKEVIADWFPLRTPELEVSLDPSSSTVFIAEKDGAGRSRPDYMEAIPMFYRAIEKAEWLRETGRYSSVIIYPENNHYVIAAYKGALK